MRLIQKSLEVYLAEGDIFSIGQAEIEILKQAVTKTPLGRVRINLHPSSDDTLHEMFLVVKQGSYIRVHKHPGKSEAFHLVHGSANVVIYEDDGRIREIVRLDADHKDKPFYYRMSKPYFHTLIIESELLIFHEITNGPFIPGGTIYAPFSPHESDVSAIAKFEMNLKKQIMEMELA